MVPVAVRSIFVFLMRRATKSSNDAGSPISGVNVDYGGEASEGPTEFEAMTEAVYVPPLVRREMEQLSGPEVTGVAVQDPAGLNPASKMVAVYEVIGRPPSDDGGFHEMMAEESAPTTVTFVGGSGTKASGIATVGTEAALVSPAALVAVTVTR